MVSWKAFVEAVEKIRSSYTVTYKDGSSGQKSGDTWLCDCRGLILWALRLLGVSASSAGTNWMIRNQMTSVKQVSRSSELTVGQVVFKSRTDISKLPAKYRRNGSAYDARFGEIDVYHVGVVTQVSPSLIIRHCTNGGIKTDTKIGGWNWAGWVKWVSADAPAPEYGYTAKVVAESGKTVNLRKAANKSSTILKRVPIGSEVTVIDEQTTWHKIKYGNLTGFMMAEFLERG